MLEMFFDNEKSFSVFKYLLQADDYVTPADIGQSVKLTPRQLRRVIDNFELLDIVQFASPLEIKLNFEHPIVFGICFLDDLVERYFMDTKTSEMRESKENGNFQQAIVEASVRELSLADFIKFVKQM